jgi:hypothetical protein
VALREKRDRRLPMPTLILHSLQVNIRGGRLPEPENNGRRYLKIPLDALNAPSRACIPLGPPVRSAYLPNAYRSLRISGRSPRPDRRSRSVSSQGPRRRIVYSKFAFRRSLSQSDMPEAEVSSGLSLPFFSLLKKRVSHAVPGSHILRRRCLGVSRDRAWISLRRNLQEASLVAR